MVHACTVFDQTHLHCSIGHWTRGGGVSLMMEIPSCSSPQHHPGSASGFYSPDQLVQPISIPGTPQRLINTAHFPKDNAFSHIHEHGSLACIPAVQHGPRTHPACSFKGNVPFRGTFSSHERKHEDLLENNLLMSVHFYYMNCKQC